MKKLTAIAIAATTLLATAAQAASFNQTFDVTVALTSACRIQGGPVTPVVDFGAYTAFQTTANTPASPASFNVECTRNLAAPTYSFDSGSGAGVVAGLSYTVSASHTGPTGGADATATLAAVADVYTVELTGTMPAGQPGQSGAATTATRTLTITY
jgi:hypothetical protein